MLKRLYYAFSECKRRRNTKASLTYIEKKSEVYVHPLQCISFHKNEFCFCLYKKEVRWFYFIKKAWHSKNSRASQLNFLNQNIWTKLKCPNTIIFNVLWRKCSQFIRIYSALCEHFKYFLHFPINSSVKAYCILL